MKPISLNGVWSLQQVGKRLTVEARVPGDLYADLVRTRSIPDPYYRDNELQLQWIGESDWVYSRDFDADAALLAHTRVVLCCDGLDTLASISLNGHTLATTNNMHRRWRFDVKAFLKEGRNTLEITFKSAAEFVKAKMKEHWLPHWHQKGCLDGQNWIRKEPCNFGWDWGPCLITAGIWRDIRLETLDVARLADVHIQQTHSGKRSKPSVQLHIRSLVESLEDSALDTRVTVSHDGVTLITSHAAVEKGSSTQPDLRVPDPQLWWPAGMGEQPLYTVTVELLDADGKVVDRTVRRIGLRTLVLDRHADEWGESFQFVANGIPFFAKGANWIPADAILGRLTRKDYERLIQDTAWANMNMLRVWGGGIYEDDAFYDLCDEYGICIWQDFMFACVTYPAFDPTFLANVRAEAMDNVRRLRHHPSIALWCGNNELEQGLVDDTWTDRAMSWEDYGKLFDTLLPEVVRELDPERDYWPCSPHSPVGSRKDFNNPTCGDAHLWSVWHGQQPFEWYRTCEHRFNSEFGFQSFPEPRTVAAFTRPEDRNVTTYILEHHQRSGIGNTTIMRYMLDWFRLPTGFDNTLWLSQILQGMAMKYACEHWRRSMPRGMGTLYWQLNDCWPAASWASIDHVGRYKALHYMARHFYAPILLSGLEDLNAGTVELNITSDLLAPTEGELSWTLLTPEGEVIDEGSKAVKAKANANTKAVTLRLKRHVDGHGARNLMLFVRYAVDGETVATNFVTFARPKHLSLESPGISTRVQEGADGSFRVTLSARKPALWTWLELSKLDARWSDNFVHLQPGHPVTIDVTPARKLDIATLRERLQVHSLYDTYQ